ncbi:MAG: LytTR family DNA-binding domain-containing protein [Bacteroidota bacterium]
MVRDLLGDRLGQLEVAGNLDAARKTLLATPPNLILLDLNLNGREGFDLLRTFTATAADTIIISAYHDKALEAFEYGVLDFVPKPVRRKRLALALARFQRSEPLPERRTARLTVRRRGELRILEVTDIVYARAADGYVELYLHDGSRELTEKSLTSLERLLPPRFFRIHKSYLVDMETRSELLIEAGARYRLRLQDGTLLPVGRSRYPALKAAYFPH